MEVAWGEPARDNDGWTLDDLAFGAADVDRVPDDASTVVELTAQLHKYWICDVSDPTAAARQPTVASVLVWLFDKLQINAANFTWADFDKAHKLEEYKLLRLKVFVKHHSIQGGEVVDMLHQISNVLYSMRDVLKHAARLTNNLSPHDSSLRMLMEPAARALLEKDNENIDHHDESRNSTFQNAYCHLREILQGCNYRRAAGKLFELIVSRGIETMAFKEACTVEEFISIHTAPDLHFKAWRCITSPPSNYPHMVDYFRERPLAEAPDLHENRHLRSYGGDSFGRNAGVYDCKADMIFWYHMRDQWKCIAQKMQAFRRNLYDPEYKCTAPLAHDVCVVHLDVPFPYDIYGETVDIMDTHLHLRWCEVDAFECEHTEFEVHNAQLREILCTTPGTAFGIRCGTAWQPTSGHPEDAKLLEHEELRDALQNGTWHFTSAELDAMQLSDDDIDIDTYIRMSEGIYAMPLLDMPYRRKCIRLTPEQWDACCDEANCVLAVRPQSFCKAVVSVTLTCTPEDAAHLYEYIHSDAGRGNMATLEATHGSPLTIKRVNVRDPTYLEILFQGCAPLLCEAFVADVASHGTHQCQVQREIRYYRVFTGRTWADCRTPEIDQIFKCQKFTPYDCFYIYALLGRLFFKVGELDNHEITLFFEGIGGSGKSTLIKAISPFWPPHLRAVLSSNMQPQFGMSSIAHGAVVMCTEVSANLNVPQEEWQDATGGAWLSLAVKHKDPLVKKWDAQFIWAGNQFPKGWKNGQGQVSRRIAGVGMYHPVQPRDGTILQKIVGQLGASQRCYMLAYAEFLRLTGSTDPMSKPQKLPPAFAEYYRKGRRETDPVEDFLSDGHYVKVHPSGVMLMGEFKELYHQYRADHDLGKSYRWKEETYRTPFSERSINVVRMDRYVHDGQEYTNVDVLYGVAPANSS